MTIEVIIPVLCGAILFVFVVIVVLHRMGLLSPDKVALRIAEKYELIGKDRRLFYIFVIEMGRIVDLVLMENTPNPGIEYNPNLPSELRMEAESKIANLLHRGTEDIKIKTAALYYYQEKLKPFFRILEV